MSQEIRHHMTIVENAANGTEWCDWHGHVRSRPDGVRARCGGPKLCSTCKKEEQQFGQTISEGIENIPFASDEKMEIIVATDYDKLEDHLSPMGKLNGLDVKIYQPPKGETKIRIFVMDGERPVGRLMMVQNDQWSDFYTVISIWFVPEYRGRGLAGRLYGQLIQQGVRFISDKQQSADGRRLWQRFIGQYRVFLFKNPKELEEIHSVEEMEPAYEPSSQFRLMVSK